MGVQCESTSAIYKLQKSAIAVRREILYNIFNKFSMPMISVRLNKMCLHEM
jgi:hypothetical protein